MQRCLVRVNGMQLCLVHVTGMQRCLTPGECGSDAGLSGACDSDMQLSLVLVTGMQRCLMHVTGCNAAGCKVVHN